MAEVYFFGCIGWPGHQLWQPSTLGTSGASRDQNEIDGWPWRWGELDGKYPPGGSHWKERGSTAYRDELGKAAVVHHEGWTVLAMWDRSVDTRGACNAAFIARGEHDFATMVKLAGEHFFAVFERIWAQAPLVQVCRDTVATRRCQAARKAWLDPGGPEVRCECGHLVEEHCLDDEHCTWDPEEELAGRCSVADCECYVCRPESVFDIVGRQLGGRELRDGDGRRIA